MKKIDQIIAGTLAGMASMSIMNSNPAEAKPNYQNEVITQAQREPTPEEDLRRYGNKAKKAGRRFINNIKERRVDYILREAKECQATLSKTERYRDKIKKARELNK